MATQQLSGNDHFSTNRYKFVTSLPLFTIRSQIEKNSEVKKQGRLDYLEEGRKVRQRLEDERVKVDGIKQQKLRAIQDLGIDSKY